jgi:hypothetical protein
MAAQHISCLGSSPSHPIIVLGLSLWHYRSVADYLLFLKLVNLPFTQAENLGEDITTVLTDAG